MVCLGNEPRSFSIRGIQVYAPTTNAKEAEDEEFYEDLQDLLALTPQKDVLFIKGTGMQKQEVRKHLG